MYGKTSIVTDPSLLSDLYFELKVCWQWDKQALLSMAMTRQYSSVHGRERVQELLHSRVTEYG